MFWYGLLKVIITASAIFGFCRGYLAQQVSVAVNSVLVGFLIASVIVIPPWPFFRRNPIEVRFFNVLSYNASVL